MRRLSPKLTLTIASRTEGTDRKVTLGRAFGNAGTPEKTSSIASFGVIRVGGGARM
jgi:hypothetical protein